MCRIFMSSWRRRVCTGATLSAIALLLTAGPAAFYVVLAFGAAS